MPGCLEQMLHLHTRLRHKAVFTFQVASISSIAPPPPPPLNLQAYAGISQSLCRNKQEYAGISKRAFCFHISELVPLAKQMFIIPLHKCRLGRGWVQLTSAY